MRVKHLTVRLVVAEVQGGVAEMGQDVRVLEAGAIAQGAVQCGPRSRPVAPGGEGQAQQEVSQASAVRGVVGHGGGGEGVDVVGGAAVRAVGAQQGCRDRQLEGTRGIDAGDAACGHDEGAVGVEGRADVDVDAAAEALDVRPQQRVVGIFPRRGDQRAGERGLAGGPGVAGGGEQPGGTCGLAVGEVGGARAAAAAAYPPRCSARAAAASRAAATAASGPSTDAARCQACRSGSVPGSRTSAMARCAWRRSPLVAAW